MENSFQVSQFTVKVLNPGLLEYAAGVIPPRVLANFACTYRKLYQNWYLPRHFRAWGSVVVKALRY